MMKKSIFLGLTISFLIGCTSDDSNPNTHHVTVSIENTGLSDDKLTQNNSAKFTAIISGFDGDAASLSYRWTLTTENGELTDGVNPVPNSSVSGSSINCVGKTPGEEVITVEVLDASNAILALASYPFTILPSDDPGSSRGCFDQPKFIYRNGTFNFVMNFDGTNVESLGIGGGTGVAISPNGEWIAQARGTQYGWQMHLFRCDGSTGFIPIPVTYKHADNNPKFSLDSKKLYFTRAVESQNAPPNSELSDIFVYDLETGALNNLTSIVQQDDFVLGHIAVSPTTGDIAFLRQNLNTLEVKLSFVQPESGLITDFTTLPQGVGNSSLDFSPNGGDIIFWAQINSTPGIYRINLTSGSQPLLVYQNEANSDFSFYPTYYNDGDRIAWVGPSRNGQTGLSLFSTDANGEDLQTLLDANSSTVLLYGILR